METKVINLYKELFDVYIGRSGRGQDGYFGNPFAINIDGNRDEVLLKFKIYFYERLEQDETFRNKVLELKGKILGCFCKPQTCHGDILVEYLNNL